MEERYKMALEAILTLIENDAYAGKDTIKAMCETALMRDRIEKVDESEDKEV